MSTLQPSPSSLWTSSRKTTLSWPWRRSRSPRTSPATRSWCSILRPSLIQLIETHRPWINYGIRINRETLYWFHGIYCLLETISDSQREENWQHFFEVKSCCSIMWQKLFTICYWSMIWTLEYEKFLYYKSTTSKQIKKKIIFSQNLFGSNCSNWLQRSNVYWK